MSDVVVQFRGDFRRAPGSITDIESMVASANLINLIKRAGETLERHFPRWLWQLRPDEHGGIVDIFSLRLSARLAYTLHLPTLQNDPNLRCIVKAGGEILERFGFRRVPYSYAEWRRREQLLGQFIPDVSDLPPAMRRAMNTDRLQVAVKHGHAKICIDPRIGAALAAREAPHHVN